MTKEICHERIRILFIVIGALLVGTFTLELDTYSPDVNEVSIASAPQAIVSTPEQEIPSSKEGGRLPAVERDSASASTQRTETTAEHQETTLPSKEKGIHCQWIVIAGDSNIRNSFYYWEHLERQKGRSKILQGTYKPKKQPTQRQRHLLECNEGTWKWSDREMVLLSNSNGQQTCRIVTLKFMNSQPGVSRLSIDNLLNHMSPYCPGYELETVLPSGFVRPNVPDTMWLSHGIWGFPKNGVLLADGTTTISKMAQQSASEMIGANNKTCQERFQPHVETVKGWIQQGVRSVTWQTLFNIRWHPETTNADLDWDYQCQMKATQEAGLSNYITDIYQEVKPRVQEMFGTGDPYHFNDHSFLVRKYFEKCCGGWDHYWAN